MLAVDTNVLVRALTGDDPIQSPSAESFIRSHAPVWISHVVLVQTIWVLVSVFDRSKKELIEAIKRVADNKFMALEDPAVVHAALAAYENKGKAGLDDYIILEIARKAGCLPLVTFEKDLGKAEGAQRLIASS